MAKHELDGSDVRVTVLGKDGVALPQAQRWEAGTAVGCLHTGRTFVQSGFFFPSRGQRPAVAATPKKLSRTSGPTYRVTADSQLLVNQEANGVDSRTDCHGPFVFGRRTSPDRRRAGSFNPRPG